MSVKITGTGSYIPLLIKKNNEFLNENFLNSDGSSFKFNNEVIIKNSNLLLVLKKEDMPKII